MSENQYEQLSFDFEDGPNPDLESSVEDLFSENDLIRFGKGWKGWYENDTMKRARIYLKERKHGNWGLEA